MLCSFKKNTHRRETNNMEISNREHMGFLMTNKSQKKVALWVM
jgi:hypothetical protein